MTAHRSFDNFRYHGVGGGGCLFSPPSTSSKSTVKLLLSGQSEKTGLQRKMFFFFSRDFCVLLFVITLFRIFALANRNY